MSRAPTWQQIGCQVGGRGSVKPAAAAAAAGWLKDLFVCGRRRRLLGSSSLFVTSSTLERDLRTNVSNYGVIRNKLNNK